MSGLSKICGLPQMKMAWLVASGPAQPKAEALARLDVIADTYLSVSTPIQLATPVLLKQQGNFQTQVKARVRENLAELDRLLRTQTACSRLGVEGGWYAVLRIPVTQSDEDCAIELLAGQSVYIHPGHFYNFPGEGYLVASLIVPPPEFAEGIKRLLAMF
jgi:aspartate/methionine/tyrosine aminotransferase